MPSVPGTQVTTAFSPGDAHQLVRQRRLGAVIAGVTGLLARVSHVSCAQKSFISSQTGLVLLRGSSCPLCVMPSKLTCTAHAALLVSFADLRAHLVLAVALSVVKGFRIADQEIVRAGCAVRQAA